MSKVWLIPGYSKGFGRALTEQLIPSTDAQVLSTIPNYQALKGLAQKYPDRLLALALDVTKAESIHLALKEPLHHLSHIDVLVNNAGYGQWDP